MISFIGGFFVGIWFCLLSAFFLGLTKHFLTPEIKGHYCPMCGARVDLNFSIDGHCLDCSIHLNLKDQNP